MFVPSRVSKNDHRMMGASTIKEASAGVDVFRGKSKPILYPIALLAPRLPIFRRFMQKMPVNHGQVIGRPKRTAREEFHKRTPIFLECTPSSSHFQCRPALEWMSCEASVWRPFNVRIERGVLPLRKQYFMMQLFLSLAIVSRGGHRIKSSNP